MLKNKKARSAQRKEKNIYHREHRDSNRVIKKKKTTEDTEEK
jgi:hypothetical protein